MHVISAQMLGQWNALTDEQVITQVIGGQTALFEVLMRRYNERVYRVARAIIRDDEEAEDVMQQTYVNAYAHLRQFNGKARFSTWLTKIAINESLARVRRRVALAGRERSVERCGDLVEMIFGAHVRATLIRRPRTRPRW